MTVRERSLDLSVSSRSQLVHLYGFFPVRVMARLMRLQERSLDLFSLLPPPEADSESYEMARAVPRLIVSATKDIVQCTAAIHTSFNTRVSYARGVRPATCKRVLPPFRVTLG